MTTDQSRGQIAKPNRQVIDWLLDFDPAIRWQVMRDLIGTSEADVAVERAKIATEGWGAKLLSMQAEDGRWGGAAWNHGWNSTMHVLTLLRELGLDPTSQPARKAMQSVNVQVTWKGCGPEQCADNRFFEGEVEPCINGQVAAAGAYFRQDVNKLIERLLGEQLADGGWNCDAPDFSTRSSFNTTICVLEALLAFEQAGHGNPKITAARRGGEEYLLERGMLRRRSTGRLIKRDRKDGSHWSRFAYPNWWHYDVLRGLEYLRSARVSPDERVAEAIELVASKRSQDGRWILETRYEGLMPIEMDEVVGQPSRWITLHALEGFGLVFR